MQREDVSHTTAKPRCKKHYPKLKVRAATRGQTGAAFSTISKVSKSRSNTKDAGSSFACICSLCKQHHPQHYTMCPVCKRCWHLKGMERDFWWQWHAFCSSRTSSAAIKTVATVPAPIIVNPVRTVRIKRPTVDSMCFSFQYCGADPAICNAGFSLENPIQMVERVCVDCANTALTDRPKSVVCCS